MKASHLRLIKITGITLGILFLIFVIWLIQLDRSIQSRLKGGWFEAPIELYSQSESLVPKQAISIEELNMWLKSWGLQETTPGEITLPGQFQKLDELECAAKVDSPFLENTINCLFFRLEDGRNYLVSFSAESEISLVFAGDPLSERTKVSLPPRLYAQFYKDIPVLRGFVKVGDVPLQCIQAITAVEDSKFLEHSGVSWTGLIRAALRNLVKGRIAQGGSTITQQLVKNYFLTPERTIKRKFIEMFMALLLEARVSKDQILESYMNVIYMGQSGPFQVIGLKSASDYYFGRSLGSLQLHQCALLAAIINSPGRFNPFTQPDNAIKRREKVLNRMVEVGFLDQEAADLAKTKALPTRPVERLSEPAAYYTQAVFRELEKLGIDSSDGLKVFTSLNESAQEFAQKLTQQHVEKIEGAYKSIKEIKDTGKNLEAALISVDIKTGAILALVGGRHYSKTQFNRVLDGNRQVGSIMKPFVYLAALENRDENGNPYEPQTILQDTKFTHKYEGQEWTPKNYEKATLGEVPLYYALKNSLNIPTAKLGLAVGLENIIDVAKRAGITSEMKPFPSLTLGAFEIRPIEIAQSYQAIANFGLQKKLHSIQRIEDMDGGVIYEQDTEPELNFAPTNVGVLVSMMQQTLDSGTARLARLRNFNRTAAGKTGTTSDTKDAWFAGFTPNTLTVTWTGYDDNTPSGLTGASGALPLWIEFMKSFELKYPESDFNWPQGLSDRRTILFEPDPDKAQDIEISLKVIE